MLDELVAYLHVPEGDAGGWVTYRPSLVRALLWVLTRDEPNVRILELGTGVGSSPMLASIAKNGVYVYGIEHDPRWLPAAQALARDHVGYIAMAEIPPVELETRRWDVVFVDHGPVEARARDLALLATNPNVGLVVVHDWNCDVYGYPAILPLWKYRVDDTGRWPNTGILSNTVDLSSWLGYVPPT